MQVCYPVLRERDRLEFLVVHRLCSEVWGLAPYQRQLHSITQPGSLWFMSKHTELQLSFYDKITAFSKAPISSYDLRGPCHTTQMAAQITLYSARHTRLRCWRWARDAGAAERRPLPCRKGFRPASTLAQGLTVWLCSLHCPARTGHPKDAAVWAAIACVCAMQVGQTRCLAEA